MKQKSALKKIKFINKPPLRLYRGFLAVAFVLIVALSGAYYVLTSAAEWSGALAVGSPGSGWCMEDQNGGMSNGVAVVLNRCNNQEDQKWVLNPTGAIWNGHTLYTIQNFKSHLCVDNWGGSSALGNPLRMYTCANNDFAEQFIWTNVAQNHGLYNPQTGHCIDDKGASYTAGNPIGLSACKSSGFTNQEWFEIPNTSGSNGGTDSTAAGGNSAALQLPLKNSAGYHMCLDNNGFSSVNGNKIDVWQCNGSAAQTWTVSGNYTHQIMNNGKCLSVAGNGTVDGTAITLYSCNGSSGQQWSLTSGGTPTTLVNPHSGKCLDDRGFSTTNGTQAEIYTCNGGANQLWYPVTPGTSSLK